MLIAAGRAFGARYQMDRSLSLLAKALRLGSRRPDVLHAVGDSYRMLGRSTEAEACFRQAILLAALTTNVTRFFREPHHFDHLRDKLLPQLMQTAQNGGRVRLWSAACSSGEEPYSMALTLLDRYPEAGRYDVRILATDIDPNIVKKAKVGLYRDEAVTTIPPKLRERWLRPEQQHGEKFWSVGAEARALISFNKLNLIGDWPMKGRFDVIFCRNVVIYFEEATQVFLWNRFKTMLNPDGRLYIGHSERCDTDGYASDGMTIYKLGAK